MLHVTVDGIEALDAHQLAREIGLLDQAIAAGQHRPDYASLLSLRDVAVGRLDYMVERDHGLVRVDFPHLQAA